MMKNQLQQIKENLNSGSVQQYLSGLKKFATITPINYEVNRGQFDFMLKPLIESVYEGLIKTKNKIQNLQQITKYVNKIATNIPANMVAAHRQQLKAIQKIFKTTAMQKAQTQLEKTIQQENTTQLFKQSLTKSQSININPIRVINPVSQQVSPIQQSISSYTNLVRQPISIVNPSNIPKSIGFLQKYAIIKQKNGLGSITNQPGIVYVGTSTQNIGDQTITVPFKNQIMQYPKLPSIKNQFQYHANKTISSWNNFVKDQAKLVRYVQKISNQQNRLQYVEQQFKALNIQTFCAESLASLIYYYLFIPIQKFYKQTKTMPMMSFDQESFYENYSVGMTLSQNPLLYKKSQCVQLVKLILNNQRPTLVEVTTIYTEIVALMTKLISNLNKKETTKFSVYRQNRQNEAMQFLRQSGINSKQIDQIMLHKDYSSVKRRQFIFPNDLSNNQYVGIIMKITKDSSKQKKNLWDVTWGSQSLPCFDYIWSH